MGYLSMLSLILKHFLHYSSTLLSPFLLILQALFPFLTQFSTIKQFYIRIMQRNNGTAACASCRHQRKKCTEKCVLAPFFPVAKSQEFHAVHKTFGVSNVTKIVSSLDEVDRKKAVDSLVWEAICRQNDPVLGPYGEYQRVSDELMLYKRHCQQHYPQNHYKMGQNLIGWSGGNKGMNMNMSGGGNINSNHSGGGLNESSVIGDSCPYNSYSSMQKRQDLDNNRSIILPQQLPLNGFNHQQYYFPTAKPSKEAKCIKINQQREEHLINPQTRNLSSPRRQRQEHGPYTPIEAKQMENTIWEDSR